eukprot:TRINITY_DN6705_c0_g1_i1.p1 TRINITY_DN6705_c0_g1~~TRINITY_DN6705_c0_g1_i1.p1  ORF type:complete len:236 (-),score=56.72 TRINITY_DN6705_c0_g1_i1:27-734(-)
MFPSTTVKTTVAMATVLGSAFEDFVEEGAPISNENATCSGTCELQQPLSAECVAADPHSRAGCFFPSDDARDCPAWRRAAASVSTHKAHLGTKNRAIAKRTTKRIRGVVPTVAKAPRDALRDVAYEVDEVLQCIDVVYVIITTGSRRSAPNALRYVLGTLFEQPLPIVKQPVTELRKLCALIGVQLVSRGICNGEEFSMYGKQYAAVPVARALLRYLNANAAATMTQMAQAAIDC